MSNGTIPTWRGIPVAGPASGYNADPENLPHYYDPAMPSEQFPGLFTLQVVAVGYDSAGNIGDDPPVQYRSPFYHRQQPPVPDESHQPRAIFDGGVCTSAGWAPPGTTWMKSLGPGQGATPMSTDVWAWVNADGSVNNNPPALPGQPTLAAYIANVILAAEALKQATSK